MDTNPPGPHPVFNYTNDQSLKPHGYILPGLFALPGILCWIIYLTASPAPAFISQLPLINLLPAGGVIALWLIATIMAVASIVFYRCTWSRPRNPLVYLFLIVNGFGLAFSISLCLRFF